MTFRRNERYIAGHGISTIVADMDFETYSEAGYYFDEIAKRWRFIEGVPKGTPHGLAAVGAPVYSEHPSTEILSLAYDLKDGLGPRLWTPDFPPPEELFRYIESGGLLEAWNSAFEYHIWRNVCHARMGWPDLPYWQLRDAMAKALAFSLPGKLAKAAEALDATKKIDDGLRLINKFSKPRNPTKKNEARRLLPQDDPEDAAKLYLYNIGDISAEASVSIQCPDLSDSELQLWFLDQHINFHGVYIDQTGLNACIKIVRQAHDKYTAEIQALTGGVVQSAGEVEKIKDWLAANGCEMYNLTAEDVERRLAIFQLFDDLCDGHETKAEPWEIDQAYRYGQLPQAEACQKVLKIRSILGSASVKKVYAIQRRLSADGRLKDLFQFYGADRTGRFAGRGPQPHNMPASGPTVYRCEAVTSDIVFGIDNVHYYGGHHHHCPICNCCKSQAVLMEWNNDVVEFALQILIRNDLPEVERIFGDALAVVSGCLRGLFAASEGHDLICADFNSIEAVVLAMLAGEEWRIQVFRTHGKIYEQTASDISGIPFQEFLEYKQRTNEHHPMRKKLGKIPELASGFQGSVGAWKAFGADEFFENDEAILEAVRAWRAKSPMIVNFWYKCEDIAIAAVQNPGKVFEFRGLKFGVVSDVLYIELLSGRKLCYHQPRLHPDTTPRGRPVLKLTYMGWNSDYKKGPIGWLRLDTYGGKLTENIVQATARDILTHAMMNVQKAGYSIVLHVHDEIVSEVPVGTGSVDELESIMTTLPPWAENWPVKASGGWRGKRYRKD